MKKFAIRIYANKFLNLIQPCFEIEPFQQQSEEAMVYAE